ncbi:MAG: AAA family ATPase [Kofleriaceae bacterium]
MLHTLRLKNVGPAPELKLELASRMNLLTGDNGLGKSFLLDVVWWALTRRWPQEINPKLTSGYTARPSDPKKAATIRFSLQSKTKPIDYESTYKAREQAWSGKAGRPWNPGLVIYAHADGGFSVWDPARNYWKTKGNVDVQDRRPGYVFSPKEVWDGLQLEEDQRKVYLCNGLIVDWAAWIRENGIDAENFADVLGLLAPPGEVLEVGPLTRISLDDNRDIPTLRTAYAREGVPVLYASSGIRRALGLAYMLLWSWREHVLAAKTLGEQRTQQVVLLYDEIESHLHPRWQRSILRALLGLMKVLHRQASVQLIAATHSPLVMASAEPLFDAKKDAWFDLDLEGAEVKLRNRTFVRQGEVASWLTSEAFDLKEARSLEAEEALTAAKALSKGTPRWSDVQKVDHQLRDVLPDDDPFWLRWRHYLEQRRPRKSEPRR